MIEHILQLLEIARKEKLTSYTIDIALGKNKLPESIKEASLQLQREKL
jgi:hypothetical protein